MSSRGGGPADKSLTVPEYSRQFFERVVKGSYGETLEENWKVAGENFVSLVKKLQEAGSKDDIKVPLRVLRDEIGRAFFSGVGHKKAEDIETLFQLYDMLEASCQETLKGGSTVPSKDTAAASQLLDELRIRFVRLAVGETWEKFPELKFLALKRMYKYAVREQELLRMKGKLGIAGSSSGSGKLNAKLLRSLTMSPGGSTWQLALEDLVKSPSNKLFPFVKLLLAENLGLQAANTAAKEASAQDGANLEAGTSNVSDLSTAARTTTDFSLDDLLGLGPDTCDGTETAPERPTSDPFQPSPDRAVSQPISRNDHTFEVNFPEPHPPPAAPAPPASSNPFGESAFGQGHSFQAAPQFASQAPISPNTAPSQQQTSFQPQHGLPQFPQQGTGAVVPPTSPLFARQGSESMSGAFPPPASGSSGPSRTSSGAVYVPVIGVARVGSGAVSVPSSSYPPPSPAAPGSSGFAGSAFAAAPPVAVSRANTTSSETEAPTGFAAQPSPTASGTFPQQAFPTNFPPPQSQGSASLYAGTAPLQQQPSQGGFFTPFVSAASGPMSPPVPLHHTVSGSLPIPPIPGPSAPARQLSGTFSPPKTLARAGSLGGSGSVDRTASGALSPQIQRAASAGAGSAAMNFTSDGGFSTAPDSVPSVPVGHFVAPPITQQQQQPAPQPTQPSTLAAATHFAAPTSQPPAAQGAAQFGSGLPSSGQANSAPKPFSPPAAVPAPSPFQPEASQGAQSYTSGFGGGAFANGAATQPIKITTAGSGTDTTAGGLPSGVAFNPFGLPSPSFASPVPVFADDRFADVSPMSGVPQQPIPQPMRAPPAPPGGGGGSNKQYSAW